MTSCILCLEKRISDPICLFNVIVPLCYNIVMEERDIIERAKDYARQLLGGNCGGHDLQHTLRVYGNALEIVKTEPEADLFVVSVAALLHDVDDYKLFNTTDYQNARNFLSSNGVSEELSQRIIETIDSVSFSKNRGRRPATIDGQLVQDADRLDALGAIGIARTFAFGGEHHRPMEQTFRHFDEKLLLLKDMMNTEVAKTIAHKRHEFMEKYLLELNQEIKASELGQ